MTTQNSNGPPSSLGIGLFASAIAIALWLGGVISVTEFTIPTAYSTSLGILSGPDGNIWFTETDRGKIGRFNR